MKIGYATIGDIQDFAARSFAEHVNGYSHDKIEAKVYPAQKLGNNTQVNEGIISGAVQGTSDIPGFYGQFIPLMQVLDAPYLFPSNADKIMKILSSNAMQSLDAQALQKGFRIVAWQYDSPIYIWAKKPLPSLASLKGLKIRTFGSPLDTRTVQEWGAVPVSMPPTELYTALSEGTVGGVNTSMDLSSGLKLYEVAPYGTDIGNGPMFVAISVSKVWFNKLPANLQQDILKAGQWQTTHWKTTWEKWQATNGKKMKQHMAGHIIVWGPRLRKEMAAQNRGAYRWIDAHVAGGKALIQKIQAMTKTLGS